MLINVKDIPLQGRIYEDTVPSDIWELDYSFLSPTYFKAKVIKSGEDVIIKGEVKVDIEIECARCLENFTLKVNEPFEVVYQPLPPSLEQENELSYDELGVMYYQDNVIDISIPLRDTIILAYPMKFLCSEDCQGLCSNCGENLNHKKCDCERKGIGENNPFKELLSRSF